MKRLKSHIIGDIALYENIGKGMKKWREMFNISQTQVSKYLNVSPSVISDYESGRRKNPGINIIKRYVGALIDIDKERGGYTTKALSRLINPTSTEAILQIVEYSQPLKIENLVNALNGKVIVGDTDGYVYGHTVVDSVKAILEMEGQDFINLYGWTTERAIIFTNVSTGRSPMVAIRVSSIKPKVVVFQGVSKLDKLALKLSEREGIALIITDLKVDELIEKLKSLGTYN